MSGTARRSSADGPVFWWNGLEGRSQWAVPDEVAPFEVAAGQEHATAMAKQGGEAARLRGRKAGIAMSGADTMSLVEALSRPTSKQNEQEGQPGLDGVDIDPETGEALEGEAMVAKLAREQAELEVEEGGGEAEGAAPRQLQLRPQTLEFS